jgi:hypothetical protein
MNPYLKRQQIPRHGQKAEKRLSKRIKAKLTPASGALEGAKGDMEKRNFLIESKATKHASISVTLEWLDKIAIEARDRGKDPALVIQFVDAAGNPWRGSSWVLIPERVFAEISE